MSHLKFSFLKTSSNTICIEKGLQEEVEEGIQHLVKDVCKEAAPGFRSVIFCFTFLIFSMSDKFLSVLVVKKVGIMIDTIKFNCMVELDAKFHWL